MDYSYPLSAFQAFAICLSSFDTKLACEWDRCYSMFLFSFIFTHSNLMMNHKTTLMVYLEVACTPSTCFELMEIFRNEKSWLQSSISVGC
jgi:hypothetical protein